MSCKKYFALLLISLVLSSIFVSLDVEANSSSAGNSQDNIRDSIKEIPDNDESPLALKTHAIDEISAISAGSENTQLVEIIEHLRKSIENNFWDNFHIKSGEAFKEDKEAAQKMRVLLYHEKKPDINDEILLECLIMLVQADRKLADGEIEDAKGALLYINDITVLDEITKLIEEAEKEYTKAEEHIRNGNPVVAIEFFGKAWENANVAVSIADKNTAPAVTLTSPKDGTYTNNTLQTIAGGIEDVAIYSIKNVILSVNGVSSETPLLEGKFSQQVTLVEGVNNVQVNVKDVYGNAGEAAVSITLDTIQPDIVITGLGDEKYYNGDVLPEIKVSDTNLQSYSVILDGMPYAGGKITEEGEHILEVNAIDLAGNSAFAKMKFTIDKTPPVVAIISPANNTYVKQILEINGSASDINLERVFLRIDTVEVSTSLPYVWDTSTYANGKHAIELYAEDEAENNASVTFFITVDNTPPDVALTNPRVNAFVRQTVNIEGNATDDNPASTSLRINGQEVSASIPYPWDTTSYTDGEYQIELIALDLAGNSAKANASVTIDNTHPQITMLSPPDNAYLNKEAEINANIVEANLQNISLRINDSEVSQNLPYRWNTFGYQDNRYEVEVYAVDKAGNEAHEGVSVTVDNTPPEVSILNPLNNSYIASKYLPLLWRGTDNYGISIYELFLNNMLLERTTETSKEVNNLEDRIYETTVQAFDLANNSASDTIFFTIDTIPPEIKITGVEEGRYYNASVSPQINITDVNLNFTAVTLNEALYNGESISEEEQESLRVYAEDLAGNNAALLVNFTIDKTLPDVSLTNPADNAYLNQTVVVTGSAADINLDKISLSINGAEVADSLPHTWNTSQFPDGAYTIELSAIDKAGNSNLTSRNITVDNTHPAVSIIEPQDRAFVRGNIQINGTAGDINSGAVSLKIDGSAVSSVFPYAWDTSGYSDGAHSIELSAIDKAGNNASTTITVIVDNTLPEVTLAEPANNSYVSNIVSIEGNADDSNLNKTGLSIDGTEVSSSLPYYWNTISYTDGEHTLSFSAWDIAGNKAAVEIMVTVDNTVPIVSIISPPDGAVLRQTVEINGTITEMNAYLISLKIDGTGVAGSIPYLWDTSAYPDGAHSIGLNVSDKASNYAEASVNVTIDNTPPLLAVSELNLNPTLNNAEYSLLITAEADAILDVNDTPVALENGSGIYRTNITSGINAFTVTAIDLAGNPSVWKKTILVDEDTLPDWYEINVTGTDPLDGDSDSSLTLTNEAGNGIKDDAEDFDSDRLSNREEFAYGLDPFKSDTEGDGLNDWYELRISGTNPLLLDSDNNSVNDQNEDNDGDLLNNLMEQGYNTNPLSNDTDEDSLSDYREITELKTDPLKKDTDNDFLDDSIELKPFFNTDPNNPDTNSNGILDGNETYEQKVGNKTLGIEVIINSSDNREGTFIFEDVGDKLKIDSDVFIGKPINILAREKFSNMKIKMRYDETGIKNESDLAIFYFDEMNHSFVLLKNQSVNMEENYILAETNHLSDFIPGSIQGYNNQFQNSNAPTTPDLKAGDEIRINARVHNIGIGEAKDVAVDFYNGDPDKGGMFIGRNVTTSIGGNRSALASVKWKVNFNQGMNIFVKVDPNSTVVETREDNNIAGRFLDNKSIDSDSDGLTDYDEINGLRTAMGKTFFTDPNNPDTDGDGLDDGKEMGRVMNGSQGRYYYLFSYPNLADSDGDKLSDKDEYDFGSSGLDDDTDYDRLSDFEEYQLGTLPRDPDTDRDGLTDWWETVTDTSINNYGATDPKNRDSDGDGAIDGGEVNLYPGEHIDVDGDGRDDAGKELDLNGDGIIEMGEENYYETPPNEVTYFLDIFAVADQEYRDYYSLTWDSDNYKNRINFGVDLASVYFMGNFSIKLRVVEISDKVWNSDDAKDTQILSELLRDANIEYSWQTNKKSADAMVAFTGKSPDYEGIAFSDSVAIQIPELSDPRVADFAWILEILNFGDADMQIFWTPRLIQHEISHLFGAYDYGLENPNYHTQDNVTGERLARIPGIMDKTRPSEDPEGFKADRFGNIWFSNKWNLESILIINTNKTSVTNGSYKKYLYN